MKKIIFLIAICLIVSAYIIGNLFILKSTINNSTYLGMEYTYIIEGNRHSSENYYKFYKTKKDEIICVHNNKITKINTLEDLENLYINQINAIVPNKQNSKAAYDENNHEITSYVLKEKMFPSEQSDYFDIKDKE